MISSKIFFQLLIFRPPLAMETFPFLLIYQYRGVWHRNRDMINMAPPSIFHFLPRLHICPVDVLTLLMQRTVLKLEDTTDKILLLTSKRKKKTRKYQCPLPIVISMQLLLIIKTEYCHTGWLPTNRSQLKPPQAKDRTVGVQSKKRL